MPAPRWRHAALAAALALAAPCAWAQPMSFDAALAQMGAVSDRIAASRLAVESADLRRRSADRLGGPVVSLHSGVYAYKATIDLDLTQLQHSLPGFLSQLPPQTAAALARLPALPDTYAIERQVHSANASVGGVWPLYTAGSFDGARGVLSAKADEARAEAAQTTGDAHTQLVQRYFGAQLAERAAHLREAALAAIAQHDEAAQKMLAAGSIAPLERLQTRAALEDARRAASKARGDADLAATALARTVKAHERVTPTSPLFVHTAPLPPLAHFIDAALARHPGLAKVAAKKREAEQLHTVQEAQRRPHVYAFGQAGLQPKGHTPWVAGVAMRWTLWDGIDRNALSASSQALIEQAERSDAQARSDIALLVERHWLAADQARRQYLAGQASADVAAEMLRLRQVGLREGASTTLELIDAQVNQAKVLTERAQSANDYVQALAALLQASGLHEEFGQYMARADVQLPSSSTP